MTINYDSECAPSVCAWSVCVCCLLGGVKLLMNMLNVSLAYTEEKKEGRERDGEGERRRQHDRWQLQRIRNRRWLKIRVIYEHFAS